MNLKFTNGYQITGGLATYTYGEVPEVTTGINVLVSYFHSNSWQYGRIKDKVYGQKA